MHVATSSSHGYYAGGLVYLKRKVVAGLSFSLNMTSLKDLVQVFINTGNIKHSIKVRFLSIIQLLS